MADDKKKDLILVRSFIIFALLFCSSARAADWKNPADSAIQLSPGAILSLENKKDKSAQDVYRLTIVYYREYQQAKLKKLFNDNEKNIPDSPVLKLLQGIILMWDHRHQESRNILTNAVKAYPDFYPAQIALLHLDYLQKDFVRVYRMARPMIDKKSELSRFHLTVSLLLAAGSKGFITRKNLIKAIPAYFEVNRYFKEAQKLMPDSAEVLYGVGSYRLVAPAIAGGNLDSAIQLLERSGQLTPLNTNVYVRLAQAYRAKGNLAAYQKNIARAWELDPQDELLLDYVSGEKVFLDVP
jgi:tetratricopeptide (TPR) repeat protein